MPKQSESGADDAAQRLRQMLRAAYLKRSSPKDEPSARADKSGAARKPKKTGKSGRN